MKLLLSFFCAFFLLPIYGQDTLRLEKEPLVTLKSWYPEFKESPALKIGEQKVLFAYIPDFEKTSIYNNDINLEVRNGEVEIVETEKTNQYLVTVNKTDAEYIEIEVWFELGDATILLKQNASWIDIRQHYPVKGNRILIQVIKLKVVK
ncbi:MAG: hypothetical protein ACRCYO_08330 [Bacteroidia bacterium]